MQVTFYKTSLTPLQRMYDKNAYESYFASSYVTATTIEVNNLIVENYDFFISAEAYNTNKLNLYNYIKWVNNGITYCAFITKISYLANNKTYRVSHALDSWAFACYNTNFNILGKCSRAHVNDIIEKYSDNTALYTLRNTLNSCEESFSTRNIKIKKYNAFKQKSAGYDPTLYEIYKFIYVYVNNEEAFTGNIKYRQTIRKYISSEGLPNNTIPLQGNLLCGIINTFTGYCTFYASSSNLSPATNILTINPVPIVHIAELTSTYITTIFISDIPPKTINGTSFKIQTAELIDYGEIAWFVDSDTNKKDYVVNIGKDNITVTLFKYPVLTQEISTSNNFVVGYELDTPFIDKVNLINKPANYVLSRSQVYVSQNFNEYLKYGIAKLRSSVYNPITIFDYNFDLENDINTSTIIRIGISPEGSFLWYSVVNNMRNEYSAVGSVAYTVSFAPDTIKDYWTELETARSTISAQKSLSNAEWNYKRFIVNGIFNLVSDGLNLAGNTVNSAAGIVEDLSEGNIAGAVGAGLNNAGNQVRYIGKAVNFGMEAKQRTVDLKYQRKISGIDIEQAQQQSLTGITTNYLSTSYYSMLYYNSEPFITAIYLSDEALNNVGFKLHKYGYNTCLTLEEVYSNHRREKFNFISTSECEVLNVPLTIANDIVNMFNNGVFLWSNNDVGNFNQTNYQGVIENV